MATPLLQKIDQEDVTSQGSRLYGDNTMKSGSMPPNLAKKASQMRNTLGSFAFSPKHGQNAPAEASFNMSRNGNNSIMKGQSFNKADRKTINAGSLMMTPEKSIKTNKILTFQPGKQHMAATEKKS